MPIKRNAKLLYTEIKNLGHYGINTPENDNSDVYDLFTCMQS